MARVYHIGSASACSDALRSYVERSFSRSRLMRESMHMAGIQPTEVTGLEDLHRLPMVSKAELLADQQAAPPFGRQLAVEIRDLDRIYPTMAGMLAIGLTPRDVQLSCQSLSRLLVETLSLHSGDLVDICSPYQLALAGTMLDEAARLAGAGVVPGGPGHTEARARWIAAYGVTVVQAFTTYAEGLGAEYLALGSAHSPRVVLIGGELRDASGKKRLADMWGGSAICELYGAGEVGVVAMECIEGNSGMHLARGFLLEVIDPDTGEVVNEGGGEIVLTQTYREGMPFVRFRTGDITEGLEEGECACGSSAPRLGRIIGRRSDLLRVKGVFVNPGVVVSAAKGVFGEQRKVSLRLERERVADSVCVVVDGSVHHAQRTECAERVRALTGLTVDVVGGVVDVDGSVEDRRLV